MKWRVLIVIGVVASSTIILFNWINLQQEVPWLKPGAYAKYDVYNIFSAPNCYVDEYKILLTSDDKVVVEHYWLRNETLYIDIKSRRLLKAVANGQDITDLFIRPPFKSYYCCLWIPTDVAIGDMIKLYEVKETQEGYKIIGIDLIKIKGCEREAYVLKAEFGNNRWIGWYDKQTGLLLRWMHEHGDEVWYESNLIETNIFSGSN